MISTAWRSAATPETHQALRLIARAPRPARCHHAQVSRLLSVAQELGILQTPHSTLDSQPSWATPSGGTSAASPAGSRQPSGGARPPARRSEETEQATAHTRAQGRWGGQPQHVQPAWLGEQPVPPLPMPPSHWLQQAAPPQGPPGFAWAQQPVPGGAPRAPGPPPGWAERLEPPQPLRPIVTHRPAVGRQAEQHQAAAPARQADHQASHMKLLWLTQQQKLAQQRAEQQAFVEAAQRLLGQRG